MVEAIGSLKNMASDRLRILHVIPAVASRYGGPSFAVVEMCQALEREGVRPLIATTDADGRGRLAVRLGRVLHYSGTGTIFFRRLGIERFQYSPSLAHWVKVRCVEFDIVHIHAVFSHPCLAAARAARQRGVPYVVSPHGSLDPWSMSQSPWRKRALWHLGVKETLHGAAAIHYTTVAEQHLAESTLDLRRGVVIPLGVSSQVLAGAPEPSPLETSRCPRSPYVLVLGRLHPKKGIELLIDAFLEAAGRERAGHWRLVLAGDGDPGYVEQLKRSVDRVMSDTGADKIIFTGWLDGAQKTAALRGAGLLALPSHQENFGMSVVEAMACGVPVLVSPHVNLADLIVKAGAGWVSSLDRAALADRLLEVLSSEDERRRRGEAGRRVALARFSWPSVAARMVKVYRSLAKRHVASETVV